MPPPFSRLVTTSSRDRADKAETPGWEEAQPAQRVISDMCQGLNSHYFHIIGDGKLNPIVGVYIPIIRIPIKGGMTIPNIATFDHGAYV